MFEGDKMKKRIERLASRTAEWTCICRAASSLEKNPCYHSEDTVALKILPPPIKQLIQLPWYRALHCRWGIPRGMYEYVIARTKYMDAVYQQALAEHFDHIVLLGAGFDTRAIRFPVTNGHTRVYEFDVPTTQQAKLTFYQRQGIPRPAQVAFEALDFVTESFPGRLAAMGFPKGQRCLFLMEGVSMYLEPAALHQTFQTLGEYAGPRSRVAFDYVYGEVLRREGRHYGADDVVNAVSGVNEAWRFGIEQGQVEGFLARYAWRLVDHLTAGEMEARYFGDLQGQGLRLVNDTHCLVTAEK